MRLLCALLGGASPWLYLGRAFQADPRMRRGKLGVIRQDYLSRGAGEGGGQKFNLVLQVEATAPSDAGSGPSQASLLLVALSLFSFFPLSPSCVTVVTSALNLVWI